MIPLDYRSAIADFSSSSSSSPLHNLSALSSSPPLSPQSPTPSTRNHSATHRTTNHLISPRSPNLNDPFSGNSKATFNKHPSFEKYQLRAKHLRYGDPQKAEQASFKTWSLDTPQSSSRDSEMDEALQQHFFDSSDDNPSSSDWSIGAKDYTSSLSTAPSSMQSVLPAIGLGIKSQSNSSSSSRETFARVGLGSQVLHASQFGSSSSSSSSNILNSSIGRKGSKVRTFSRTQSSSKDPFGASSTAVPEQQLQQQQQTPHTSSPKGSSNSNRQVQRRRLTGTSPKKLSRASQSSQFNNISSDENSDDGTLPAWEQLVSLKPMKSNSATWNSVVEQVFEKVDGSIELSKQGLLRIDPVVADLAKFVSIPHLRKDDNISASQGSFSRTTSQASAFERSTSSTSAFNSRSRTATSDQTSTSKLQFYLAGNRLQIFPSAFFELQNLVVLIIRDNGLEELPPAIGQLVNLKELNVSQNALRHLPAEIQKLNLNSFVYFPNAFEIPPADALLSLRRTFGQASNHNEEQGRAPTLMTVPMGPPALSARAWSHSRLASRSTFTLAGLTQAAAVEEEAAASTSTNIEETQLVRCLKSAYQVGPRLPTLTDICIRMLLEPEDEDTEEKRVLLEMFESGCLVDLNKSLNTSIIKSLEAARRSAVKAWGRVRPASSREETWCSGASINQESVAERRKMKKNQSFRGSRAAEYDEASNEESFDEHNEERECRRIQSYSIEEQLDRGDDSRRNPWFNRCPNLRHYSNKNNTSFAVSNIPFDWPGPINGGRVFYQSCVERLEFVSHIAGVSVSQIRFDDVAAGLDNKKPILAEDATLIPILWRGCGPSCLDFLSGT